MFSKNNAKTRFVAVKPLQFNAWARSRRRNPAATAGLDQQQPYIIVDFAFLFPTTLQFCKSCFQRYSSRFYRRFMHLRAPTGVPWLGCDGAAQSASLSFCSGTAIQSSKGSISLQAISSDEFNEVDGPRRMDAAMRTRFAKTLRTLHLNPLRCNRRHRPSPRASQQNFDGSSKSERIARSG